MKNQQGEIAELNDQFRKGNSRLGLWIITAGVGALPDNRKRSLVQAVRTYKNFTQDNDPYGEHDFGIINWEGAEYFWEIVCYDKSLQHLTAHPEDCKRTTRVLTLMRADEYYTTPVHTLSPMNQDTVIADQGLHLK